MRIKLRILRDEVELKDKIGPKKPRLNLPNQVQMLFLLETDTVFSILYSKLEDNIKARIDKTKLRTCKD